MLNRFWVRMTLVFVAIILLGAAIIAIAPELIDNDNVRERVVSDRIDAPRGLIEKLSSFHQKKNSWRDIEPFMEGVQSTTWIGGRQGGFYFVLSDAEENIFYDPRPRRLKDLARRSQAKPPTMRPIKNSENEQTIGYLQIWSWRQHNEPSPPRTFGLLFELRQMLWLILLFCVPLGILGSIWVSRLLTSPLNQLAAAARDVGTGNLNRRVELSGTIEIREVAHAFNEMTRGLEESEQLRRNLVADIAHELRTPLTVVQGNLRAILDDVYPLNKEEITRLYDQTRILAQLVKDLRDVAQAEAGQLELNLATTNVSQLVEKTVSTFGGIAEEEEVVLHISTQEELPTVQLDSTRIAQVLHNLLSNAVRHTPRHGTITVGVSAPQNSQSIEVAIRDSGAGIDPKHLTRIFDRFYRTERARDRDSGGTGLGLAIAKALVEAHGGTIRAESPGIGQGSTFAITLPVA